MTGQQLKNSILQAAVKGELVPNLIPSDEKYGEALLNEIKRNKESIYNKGLERKSTKIATKESLTDYIFEIPDNWIWCRLGDLCHIAGRIGFRGYTKADIVTSGGAVSLSPSNIIDGFISFSRYTMISMEKYDESPEIKVRDGEIVFTKTASIGKCAYIETVPMPTTINPQMVVMKHICCNAKYLTFALQSPYAVQNYNAFVIGTSIPTFSQAVLESLLIPLPPLSIQKAIVSKIEELLPLVDEYDKVSVELNTLNNLLPDKLRKSVLQEAIHGNLVPNDIPDGEATALELLQQILKERQDRENKEKGKKAKKLSLSTIDDEPWGLPEGWCWCRLGDVGEFTRGNGIKKDEVIPEGFPCVRYGELYTRYRIQFSSTFSHVNEVIYNKSQKIENGDVVMALTGENEYDIALASVYLGTTPVAMGGDMTKLHPFIDSKYLVYVINSPYGIECKSLLATGQIIVHISNDKLASIQIPLPPLSIQHRIVEKIEEVFSAIDKLQG